jgi:hypothetical protein
MHNIPISKTIISNYIVNTRERFPTKPPNTQHGLPTAQSVLNGIKNLRTTEEREYKKYNKKKSLEIKAARNAKYPFNNI